MKKYNWYTIPGFTSYEININSREVRSNKHFNKDSHHIMKVSDEGTVRIVDDFGKPTKISVSKLYNITFKSGKKLNPREDNAVYLSGMLKGCRNSIPEVLPPEKDNYVTIDFYGTISGESSNLIKPFTIDMDEN